MAKIKAKEKVAAVAPTHTPSGKKILPHRPTFDMIIAAADGSSSSHQPLLSDLIDWL